MFTAVKNSSVMLQLVAGSAIQAFEEVCPERIDLIHRNYRKLCSLLVDVEEWGQVVIINMLTRYGRTQFLNPNAEVCLVGAHVTLVTLSRKLRFICAIYLLLHIRKVLSNRNCPNKSPQTQQYKVQHNILRKEAYGKCGML